MRVRPKEESMDELFQAILSMKTLEECRAFLEDLCTMSRVVGDAAAAHGGKAAARRHGV